MLYNFISIVCVCVVLVECAILVARYAVKGYRSLLAILGGMKVAREERKVEEFKRMAEALGYTRSESVSVPVVEVAPIVVEKPVAVEVKSEPKEVVTPTKTKTEGKATKKAATEVKSEGEGRKSAAEGDTKSFWERKNEETGKWERSNVEVEGWKRVDLVRVKREDGKFVWNRVKSDAPAAPKSESKVKVEKAEVKNTKTETKPETKAEVKSEPKESTRASLVRQIEEIVGAEPTEVKGISFNYKAKAWTIDAVYTTTNKDSEALLQMACTADDNTKDVFSEKLTFISNNVLGNILDYIIKNGVKAVDLVSEEPKEEVKAETKEEPKAKTPTKAEVVAEILKKMKAMKKSKLEITTDIEAKKGSNVFVTSIKKSKDGKDVIMVCEDSKGESKDFAICGTAGVNAALATKVLNAIA